MRCFAAPVRQNAHEAPFSKIVFDHARGKEGNAAPEKRHFAQEHRVVGGKGRPDFNFDKRRIVRRGLPAHGPAAAEEIVGERIVLRKRLRASGVPRRSRYSGDAAMMLLIGRIAPTTAFSSIGSMAWSARSSLSRMSSNGRSAIVT